MTTWSSYAEKGKGPTSLERDSDGGRVLSLGSRLLEDSVLNAYVDDILAPRRRREIDEYLLQMPRERARVRSFQAQNRRLHELFDNCFAAPLPHELEILEHRLLKSLARRRQAEAQVRQTIVIAIVIVAAFACGSLLALSVGADASEIFATLLPSLR